MVRTADGSSGHDGWRASGARNTERVGFARRTPLLGNHSARSRADPCRAKICSCRYNGQMVSPFAHDPAHYFSFTVFRLSLSRRCSRAKIAVLNLSRPQPTTELPKLRSPRRSDLAANVRRDRDRARTPRRREGRDEAKAGHNKASARTSAAGAWTARPALSA